MKMNATTFIFGIIMFHMLFLSKHNLDFECIDLLRVKEFTVNLIIWCLLFSL